MDINYWWFQISKPEGSYNPSRLISDLNPLSFVCDETYGNMLTYQIATYLTDDDIENWREDNNIIKFCIFNSRHPRKIGDTYNDYDAFQLFITTYQATFCNSNNLSKLEKV